MGAEDASVKAAAAVRRVIQKVRVATPENFDQLESELLEALEQHLSDLGDKFETVQEAADKGLELGRKRVEQILSKREKEETSAGIPKELLKELGVLVKAFEEKTIEFKAAAGLEGDAKLNSDDVPAVEKLASEFRKESQDFTKAFTEFVKTKMATIKTPTLPVGLKKEFEELSKNVDQCQKAAESALSRSKDAIAKVLAVAKKEMFEQAKLELKEKIKEASAPLVSAEQAVEKAEKYVEPFAKLKTKSVEEMLALAEEVDEVIAFAREAVTTARGLVRPADNDVDEAIKQDLRAWLAAEAKRPEMRLGQMERRLARATQLVRQYRRDVNKTRNVELIKELKPKILEKAKAAAENPELVNQVDVAIKEAEKLVEPFPKSGKLPVAEMTELVDRAAEAVAAAKAAMVEARRQLCPIDDTLDEDLKKQLNAALASALGSDVRKVELRLGQIERRLTRAANLVTNFRAEVQKKTAAQLKEVREVALRVMAHTREMRSLSYEDLFNQFDTDSSGSIDEAKFISFFESADIPEGESTALTAEDLKPLFANYCQEGGITKEAFMELSAAYLKVVKGTPLTVDLSVSGSKALRQLKLMEILQVIEGPKKDGTAGLTRVKVKPLTGKDDTQGWATVVSNTGAVFLKECSGADVAKIKK